MISWLARKLVGTKNQRELKRLEPVVAAVNSFEPAMQALSDAELAHKTVEFRERLARMQGEGLSLQDSLNRLLPEAFAVVREAGRRTLGMRHFDVQIIGGIVLHQGKIAEMRTGEGKTLVSTLPAYLNALAGKGVHVITVNDYLAARDADWMGKIHRALGMTVGVITPNRSTAQRKAAYACDITYGTNSEMGFDYLRDNMKFSLSDYVQREHYYAIVDEVDSILIDEARTPLIISGPTELNSEKYYFINSRVAQLIEEEKRLGTDPTLDPEKNPPEKCGKFFHIDLEHRHANFTEEGVKRMEQILGIENLFAPDEIETIHHVNQALSAHTLYLKDKEYVIQDGEVVIVDEFTGRMMEGRRWSDGLHQAVEAKEGVQIQNENQTLATITYQNYFKMYNKLAGMTGTADTEAGEFSAIYNLDVVVIPTNKPMIRQDETDLIFKSRAHKVKALIEDIQKVHETGAPILIGTTSVEASEELSRHMIRSGIRHEVLNAKNHSREAQIVAQAGQLGAVTIATNMVGRGTDIVLGGNPEYFAWTKLAEKGIDRSDLMGDQFIRALLMNNEPLARQLLTQDERLSEDLIEPIVARRNECEAARAEVRAQGGLHIFGTERHESRRVDNQLRGRAGRQGDPGASRFYLSLEDDLIKIFGGERILGMMERLGMEDEAIEHPLLNRSIESAQIRVEARNFEIRKNLLKYDDVMSSQRKTVYTERRAILGREELFRRLGDSAKDVVSDWIEMYVPERADSEAWDWTGLKERYQDTTGEALELPAEVGNWKDTHLTEYLDKLLLNKLSAKQTEFGEKMFDDFLQFSMLQVLDQLWRDHLLAMDSLRQGINLQGYAQKDPKQEYQKQGFAMFQQMIQLFRAETVARACRVQLQAAPVNLDLSQLERPVVAEGQANDPAALKPAAAAPKPAPQAAARPAAPSARPTIKLPVGVNPPAARGAPAPMKAAPNDPCPCGSGKKFKKCHGRTA